MFRRALATSRRYSTKVATKETASVLQAPNRQATWSPSQRSREDIVNDVRFVQKDLTKQPQPYSAMELIAQEPVRYLEHTNIAVCNGNKDRYQGHPKVFINLDPARPNTCGYCGLRFAQAKYKDQIEAALAKAQ